MTIIRTALALLSVVPAAPALAGAILFVNYNGSDNTIPAALAADGHVVTAANVPPSTANSYFQNVNLNQYCAVVWSTAYQYDQSLGGATSVLSNWISSGGHLLITTPDGIRASGTYPNGQPDLVGLLGGAGATDQGNNYSTVANVQNSLTTGLVDIRGQQPPPIGDMDALCAPLAAGTVGLVTAQNTSCSSGQGYAWSLRTVGAGEAAFITSGNFTSGDDPDWSVTSIPGDGVYNAGLRNFALSACTARTAPTPVPSLSEWGLGILSGLLAVLGLVAARRKSHRPQLPR